MIEIFQAYCAGVTVTQICKASGLTRKAVINLVKEITFDKTGVRKTPKRTNKPGDSVAEHTSV